MNILLTLIICFVSAVVIVFCIDMLTQFLQQEQQNSNSQSVNTER